MKHRCIQGDGIMNNRQEHKHTNNFNEITHKEI